MSSLDRGKGRRVGQGREASGGASQTGQPSICASPPANLNAATAVPPASRFARPTLQPVEEYWRSLTEWAETPGGRDFLEAEFPATADPQGISRRRWLQLMGASLALAGAAGCRWEKRELRPFAKRPADRVPGQPQRFATAMDMAGQVLGLMVTCVDGRPIKVEGNPKHPTSLGATNAFAQAAILELYDPDRSKEIIQRTGEKEEVRTWYEFDAFAREHFAALKKNGGEGFHVLSEASSSLTLGWMFPELLEQAPKSQWHFYEPVRGSRSGWTAYSDCDFSLLAARTIVCLDADILDLYPGAVRYAREFAGGRDAADGEINRLYVAEPTYSVTGAAADHRLAVRCQDIAAVARALHHEIEGLASGIRHEASKNAFIRAAAQDLWAHRGKGVVLAGPRQPFETRRSAYEMNAMLGNVGETIVYLEGKPDPVAPGKDLAQLAADIHSGKVRTLLMLGGNAAYDAPVDLDFTGALAKVPTSIHLGLYRNETSRLCTWHIPQSHFLEAWGDALVELPRVRAASRTAVFSAIQPLIEPLHSGKSALDLLALIVGVEAASGDAYVRKTFSTMVGDDDGRRWRELLHDGADDPPVISGRPMAPTGPHPKAAAPSGPAPEIPAPPIKNGELEIIFCPDSKVYDGRFANNGWLQELPDPMTRLTWDNAALMSPATAAKLGVASQDVVRLQYEGRELEAPVYVMPGQADGTVALPLGYGRTAAGKVGGSVADGVPPVGFNAYLLRTSKAMDFGSGLRVEPTGRTHVLATTQDHFAIDTAGLATRLKRIPTLVREATLRQYRDDPKFAQEMVEHPPLDSLWQEPRYDGHRWGMTIDLSRCIGCGACVVACQAENNIPVVGKDRVLRGRQMQWLRIDRYFRGAADSPQVVYQPVACQQCEMAPCEAVCPVAATTHSHEGLNDMVYNRCVGTRYCSNNCPYKVRRFNFFNYHKDLEEPQNEVAKMAYNPEVTVRSRGVMEKCTYCVQRIQNAKIVAKNERRPLVDGEIKTACQQACPTQAITFGDLADRTSAVARLAASDRAYGMLAELNVKPRTSYLARIRNPNPELEK